MLFSIQTLEQLENTRKKTEAIIRELSSEDCQIQVNEDVSPMKWHLGHTSWFFERMILEPYQPEYKVFNTNFHLIFNSYYEGAGSFLAKNQRGFLSRPSLSEIMQYRQYVNQQLFNLLKNNQDIPNHDTIYHLLQMGIEHEKQHQELMLTDIKRNFFANPILPSYENFILPEALLTDLSFMSFPEGLQNIGTDLYDFSYDNERPKHRYFVNQFAIADRLISNGEFLDFIEDGGYERPELWLSDGFAMIKNGKKKHPFYWLQQGQNWFEYSLAGLRPLQKNLPVCHVSFYEADAYARWADCRLPTEFEWEVAAQQLWQGDEAATGILHPTYQENPGLQQMFYCLWQWTTSYYLPYPGFVAETGAVGEYNGKFMNDQRVLRGGSCVSPKQHIRPSYRNYFPGDKTWQFTGIRLAKDL